MKKLRGTRAVALAASVAMLFSAFAISPANAADSDTCIVADETSFTSAITTGTCGTVDVAPASDGIINFNYEKPALSLVSVPAGEAETITVPAGRKVTVTSSSEAILRNVQFVVPSGADLTFAGQIVLDDVNLSGLNIVNLLGFGAIIPKIWSGVQFGVKVDGGTFSTADHARIAVGADGVDQPNRAILVSSNNSTVNLASSGEYDRQSKVSLLDTNLGVLNVLLKPLENLLTIKRTVAYPTVWGRDAAVYSEPGVNNATINITDGSYSNQKDKEALGKIYLNGAVSSSATVNIAGTGNVQISNTKIGNGVTSDHAGSNTAGTLNISNPNAVLDPGTEKDGDATKHATDSWALELRGSAVANIVAGSIQDTSTSHKTPQVIESESNSRVNILSASDNGDVKIATRQYYIAQPAKDGAAFSSQVTYEASEGEADANAYELWSSGSTKQTTTLAQLQDLVAKETAGSTPAAAKLSQSTYSTGKISAAYLEDVNKDGRAVYGRHEISFNGSTPVQGVNSGTPGTVVLYSLPWIGTYDTGGTAPEVTNKLFAGWYTSEDAWKAEDKNQQSKDLSERFHKWDSSLESFNGTYENTVVVNTAKYTGSLYAHFVDAQTTRMIGIQTAAATAGKYNLRILSGVDSYNLKSVQYTFKLSSGKKAALSSQTFYDYIQADGAKQVYADNPFAGDADYSTEMLGDQGDARYIGTVILRNVPANTTFEVTPAWTTLDGVVVSGTPFSVTVNADGSITKQQL